MPLIYGQLKQGSSAPKIIDSSDIRDENFTELESDITEDGPKQSSINKFLLQSISEKQTVINVDTYDDLNNVESPSKGAIAYVSGDDQFYYYSSDGTWHMMSPLYVSDTAPENISLIWLDTNDGSEISTTENEVIDEIKQEIIELQNNQAELLKLINYGIVSGDASTSARNLTLSSLASEDTQATQPIYDETTNTLAGSTTEDIYSDETSTTYSNPVVTYISEPDTSDYDFTVPHLVPKLDEATNFTKNKKNLVNGELLFYTDKKTLKVYYDGGFYGSTSSGSSSSDTGSTGGLSLDELYNSQLEYLVFTDGTNNYKIQLSSDGDPIIHKYSSSTTGIGTQHATWESYVSQYLCMNTIYCGGSGEDINKSCSHNFVELANADSSDINLNGILLLYTDGTLVNATNQTYKWHVLRLEGYIKAGGTFLIRGARCNTDKASFIKVKNYDMEWRDSDGNLMSFDQTHPSFYLAVGKINSDGEWFVLDKNGDTLSADGLGIPWVKTKNDIKQGYIDACGFGSGALGESNTLNPTNGEDWNNIMFVRWYMLEPSKQGNKAVTSRKTGTLWTYINLTKEETYISDTCTQYYYPDYMKLKFGPLSSKDNKNFFTNKNVFSNTKPNYVNITFGMQATTDNENNIKASRCFNWVSTGYYNEYLQYRKKGDSDWIKVYSITKNDYRNTEAINTFIDHYQRLRWVTSYGEWVTTHKVILHECLESGTYEYKVGRENDESYYSDTLEFTVYDNSEVTNFTFIQTSDQQGFNWVEYQAWKKSALCIKNNESDFKFTINTGDITQSGNRVNEWLDYYDGRQFIRDKEEMFSIGNNDLCGYDSSELTDGNDATSKFNHINVLRYFTFELDPDNANNLKFDYTYKINDVDYTVTAPIYSTYSFNFGKYHFVSLNSEYAKASSIVYNTYNTGDETLAKNAYGVMEKWFKKDLQIWKGITDESIEPENCYDVFVFMHEMPFTMVTYGFLSGSDARAGSHLNQFDSNGTYRYSRLFKQYGIRLVMGGHKHTYTLSKPIYDAPDGYIDETTHTIDSSVDILGSDANTRRPVIQVTKDNVDDIESYITNETNLKYARYEIVDKINAPVYSMSQATGYKLVSNKEMPAGDDCLIPWLLAYFKKGATLGTTTENVAQHLPMYIKYDVTDSDVKITAKQIYGIWQINLSTNKSTFNFNSQPSSVYPKNMTLSQLSDDDAKVYGITDKESYTIKF